MAGFELPRIHMPAPDDFLRDYVQAQQPAIITDLFAGQEIRRISTLQQASEAFGNARMPIRAEYTSAAATADATERIVTFDEYWALAHATPGTHWMATEAEIPARVLSLFDVPEACLASPRAEDEILGLPKKYGDHDLLLNAFVGNRGNVAHLHYDGDQRHVLLYQVFGTKEVILFPPDRGRQLQPLHSLVFSGVSLQSMPSAQRAEFVAEHGGYRGVLHPGDTVFMPMLFWHFLEYSEDAMSFNIRFGRSAHNRFVSVDHLHRDYYIQNLSSHFRAGELAKNGHRAAFEEIVAEYVRPAADKLEKARRMRDLFRRLCRDHCPAARTDEYCPPAQEQRELDKIAGFIQHTMRYADVATIQRSRPTGEVSAQQIRHIEQAAQRLGYSSTVLNKLLSNRVGKKSLSALTRAEASQFLTYLKSPGAAL